MTILFSGFSSAQETTSTAPVGEWPQWRGPNRDGFAVNASKWPDKLDETSLTKVWRIEEMGPSYSGPIVVGNVIYTTETVDKKTEVVSAYDRTTKARLWQSSWEGAMSVPFFAAKNGSWIRSTPTYFKGRLYVGGIKDYLVCLDAKTGDKIWTLDFMKELGAPAPTFGCVCSPLVDDTGIYMQAGAAFVKLNLETGKIVWKVLKDDGGMNGSAFSSPIRATVAGQDQIVVQTRTRLAGVRLTDGEVIWAKEIPSFRGMNILTPVTFGKDSVFTSTYGGTSQLLKLSGAEKLESSASWSLKYEGHMTSPVIIADHAYVLGKDQRFICIDLKSGKEAWRTEKKFSEYWSLVAQGDKILALDSRGKLLLIKATPKEFDQLGEFKVSESNSWAHLAVAGDQVIVRDLDGLTVFQWKK
ncbi:MAG: PQQ-binding-like beta-propeller repeat protein [Fimbriiglobus sp.]